nr:MAG TPA: hypothetical protein [Caudoviricetes sp.]
MKKSPGASNARRSHKSCRQPFSWLQFLLDKGIITQIWAPA